MSATLPRVAEAFMAPRPVEAGIAPPTVAAARLVGVVCAPRDGAVAGAAAGLASLERRAARSAVVLEWSGAGPRRLAALPATRAARRVAAALAGGGLAAVPGGRLVRVALGRDEGAVVRAAVTVAAVVPGTPLVLTVAGPRGEAVEELIAGGDAAVLVTRAGADPALVELGVAELAALSRSVAAVELVAAPMAMLLARWGVRLAAPLREPFLAALQGNEGATWA